MQVSCNPVQVRQGEIQLTQTLSNDIFPTEQLETQEKDSRLIFLQEVQLVVVISHVLQSPAHITAIPEIFT